MSATAKPARSFGTGYVMPVSWVDDYERVARNARARATLRTISEQARAARVTDLDAVTITLPIDEEPARSKRRRRQKTEAA